MFLCLFLVQLVGLQALSTEDKLCIGLTCENGGVMTTDTGHCVCDCGDEFRGLFCEIPVTTSVWPVGPYAIPESIYGCPETEAEGWRQGHINITFEDRWILGDGHEDIDHVYSLHLLGLYSEYVLQLNFCYKDEYHVNSNVTFWPEGNYSMYRARATCPQGFISEKIQYEVPLIKHVSIDGYIPDIRLEQNNSLLEMYVCTRKGDQRANETNLMPNWTFPFIYLMDQSASSCSNWSSFKVTKEILFIPRSSRDGRMQEFRYCFYHPIHLRPFLQNIGFPEVDPDDNSLEALGVFLLNLQAFFHSFGVPQIYLSEMVHLSSNLESRRQHLEDVFNIDQKSEAYKEMNTGPPEAFYTDALPWLLVDLSALFEIHYIYFNYMSAEPLMLNESLVPYIFVSNSKWSFLRNGANRCLNTAATLKPFSFGTDPIWGSIQFCNRAIKGRYLGLRAGPNRETWHLSLYAFHHLLAVAVAAFEMDCERELGLTTGTILDFQITGSTSEENHPATEGKFGFSGWCSLFHDPDPFIQIDFIVGTVIEGFEIQGWFQAAKGTLRNVYFYRMEYVGPTILFLSYGYHVDDMMEYSNNNNDTVMFYVDESVPGTDGQSFILEQPVVARYVRFHIAEYSTHPCMKIAVIGCERKASVDYECSNLSVDIGITSRPRAMVSSYALISAIPLNTSDVDECISECTINTEKCVTAVFTSANVTTTDNCKLYGKQDHEDDQRVVLFGNHMHQLFQRICVNGAIKTRYGESYDGFVQIPYEGNTHYIYDITLIQSPGYPHFYQPELKIVWKIDMKAKGTPKIILEDVSLNKPTQNNTCRDRLLFKETYDVEFTSDNNGQQLVYFAKETTVDIVFISCRRDPGMDSSGWGFSAIVDIDDGVDVVSDDVGLAISDHMRGIRETIRTTWAIYTLGPAYVSLQFTYFHVTCGSEAVFSLLHAANFELIENAKICNLNRPPSNIISKYNELTINFESFNFSAMYGFVARYQFRLYNGEIEELTTLDRGSTVGSPAQKVFEDYEVCSDKLQSCYLFTKPYKNSDVDGNDIGLWCFLICWSGQCNCDRESTTELVNKAPKITWHDAEAYCITEFGGHLVSIQSKAEMKYVRYYMQTKVQYINETHTYNKAYIGLSGYLEKKWTDGNPITFTAWKPGEPVLSSIQHCTTMDLQTMTNDLIWETIACDEETLHFFICEHPYQRSSIPNLNSQLLNHRSHFLVNSTSYFPCDSGEYVSVLSMCNGVPDCLDASEEQGCIEEVPDTCHSNQFQCSNGECISYSMYCDYIPDCADQSDEICSYPKCRLEEWRCGNQQCIPQDFRCDGKLDCMDNSDETSCVTCNGESFFCDDKCLPNTKKCDLIRDCQYGQDEPEVTCNGELKSTCMDWWNAGFRETKLYKLSILYGSVYKTTVECNFEEVDSSRKIKVIFHNIGIDTGRDRLTYESDTALLQFADDKHCYQTLTQTCPPWRKAIAANLDLTRRMDYWDCLCIEEFTTFEKGISQSWPVYHPCSNETAKLSALHGEDFLSEHFIFKTGQNYYGHYVISQVAFARDYDKIQRLNLGHSEGIHIQPGPITCIEEVNTTSTISCERGTSVPASVRCLYEFNDYGDMIGCKDLTHLQECANFSCPEGYLKCPDSFCISTRLVCDEQRHCPDGEDEVHCWYNLKEVNIWIVNGEKQLNIAVEFKKRLQQIAFLNHERISVNTFTVKKFPQDFLSENTTMQENGIIVFLNSSSVVSGYPWNPEYPLPAFQHLYIINEVVYPFSTLNGEYNEEMSKDFIMVDTFDDLLTMHLGVFEHIFTESGTAICPYHYRCKASRMCLLEEQLCDGIKHCPLADDEKLCNFLCPLGCNCKGYIVECSFSDSGNKSLSNLPVNTRYLDASNSGLFEDVVLNLPYVGALNLSRNGLTIIKNGFFHTMLNLKVLDIGHNKLRKLQSNVFEGPVKLTRLMLDGNRQLEVVEPGAFKDLSLVEYIRLTGTKIHTLERGTFIGLQSVKHLDLKHNRIIKVADYAFESLDTLQDLDLQFNSISSFSDNIFAGANNLKQMTTDSHMFCCLKPNNVKEENCLPEKDEFSSCEDLMRNENLRILLWIIGFFALIGNILSMTYRFVVDRKQLKIGHGLFVTNLCVADFLMGVYLLIIASADVFYRGRYIWNDLVWRHSWLCKLAGVLSTVSSEASVLFMCLITIDRILVIKFPFGNYKFTVRSALTSAGIGWLLVLFLSVLPILYTDYFQNEFYSKRAVCLALPLTRDRPPGWVYSITIFVFLNFLTFVLIASGQVMIYREISTTGRKVRSSKRKTDLTIARNLLFVVATDFMCWCPIGIMGIMALNGHVISGEVYAWASVLILPINSALNPFLYTFSAILRRKTFSPNIDEQTQHGSRREVAEEISRVLEYGKLMPPHEEDLISANAFTEEEQLKTVDIYHLIVNLTQTLSFVHERDMVCGGLTMENVWFKTKQKKIEEARLRLLPKLVKGKVDKAHDIEKLGLLLRKLLKR